MARTDKELKNEHTNRSIESDVPKYLEALLII